MSATIFSFDEVSLPEFKFPDFIFLDTSFLINSFCPVPEVPWFPSKTNECCSAFLDILKKNACDGKTCLLTSDLVVNEFFHFILKEKAEYVELTGAFLNHKKAYERDGKNAVIALMKDHPDILRKYHPLLTLYIDLMGSIPIEVLKPDDLVGSEKQTNAVVDGMIEIIKNYNILPSDACNLAISKLLKINTFVVIDRDYHRIDNINVYTCLSKRAKPCSVCTA